MTNPDALKRQIAHELTSLNAADVDRLRTILRSLLACLQDLDGRVQALEGAAGSERAEPVLAADHHRSLPCGIRTWLLPTATTVTVGM